MKESMTWENCFEHVCNSLFKVNISYGDYDGWGTAFAVARYKKVVKQDLILATVNHLLRFKDTDTVSWNIEKYDWLGNLQNNLIFQSNNSKVGKSPIRVHGNFDIGLIFPQFFPGFHSLNPLKTININKIIKPGQKVGWAGFPSLTYGYHGNPQPCYFEGVISSVFCQGENRLYYILDGHNHRGISGGPAWIWNDELSTYEIFGIVSAYLNNDTNFPGLTIVESIKPILGYLSTSEEIAF